MEKNNVRNKIIALSGEPVSGKGTAVKNLIEQLEKVGYSKEQIHLESTGNDFREYFNSIIDLITNLKNKEVLKEIRKRKELQSFFENEEHKKALAKTVANLMKENVDLSNFSIQDANNKEEFCGIRKIIDTLIDEGMKEKGKIINQEEHPDDIWIIDSRLAFNNIPEAFSVRLTADPEVAGKRLFNDNTRGKEDSQYENVEEAIKAREERKLGEQKRYLARYGIDLEDEDNYDLIIDTSYAKPSDIATVILSCEHNYENNLKFGKKWTSPGNLLPLQEERDTLANGQSGYNFEEIAKSIKDMGYLPNQLIGVVNVDGINYIVDGHHKNFASAYLGNTLVPYEVLAQDDEKMPQNNNSARTEVDKLLTLKKLYGHEWMIKEGNNKFSYRTRFPELINKLEKERDKEQEETK